MTVTPTYIPLATITLGSAQSSVTFGSIPATYSDLIAVFDGQGSTDSFMKVYPNNDSANASNVAMYGNGSSPGSGVFTPITWGTYNTTTRTHAILEFMSYSATDKHKSVLIRDGESGTQVNVRAARWASNVAISSLVFQAAGGNMAIGTTISLYGIH